MPNQGIGGWVSEGSKKPNLYFGVLKRVKNGLKLAKSQIHTSGIDVVSARIQTFIAGHVRQATPGLPISKILKDCRQCVKLVLGPDLPSRACFKKIFYLAGMYGWILTLVRGYYTLLLTTLSKDCAHPMENVTNRPA